MRCPQCDATIPEQSKFCPQCGARHNGGEVPHESRRPKWRTTLIAGFAAVCILVIAGIFGALHFLGVDETPNTPSGEEGSEASQEIVIDENAFPDERLRTAVVEQVDANNDGILSQEELQVVTGLVYAPESTSFFLGNEGVDLGMIQDEGVDLLETAQETSTSLKGIESFPNLVTLVARNVGLTELSVANNPSLTYVDCRYNPIDSIDLAQNTQISTMFCDPEVELTGLEEAGLYFEDLLVGAANKSEDDESLAVVYDTQGRPVELTEFDGVEEMQITKYTYDGEGRLSEQQDGASLWTFDYDELGMLKQASMGMNGVPENQLVFEFVYENGKPAAINAEDFADQVFEYEKGTLSQAVMTSAGVAGDAAGIFDFSYNEEGRMSECDISYPGSSSSSGKEAIGYTASGQCQSIELTTGSEGEMWARSVHTSYTKDSFPEASQLVFGPASQEWSFECNRDGYVVRAVCTSTTNTVPLADINAIYTKGVGKLSERESRRFVPQFAIEIDSDMGCQYLTFWRTGRFLKSYGGGGALVMAYGPLQAVYDQAGIYSTRPLASPHELMLREYDRSHFK